MKEFSYTITDPIGFHARPAGLFLKELAKYKSAFTIKKGDKTTKLGKSPIALMALGVKGGDTVTITADGEDEDAAIAAAEKFMKENM